MANIPYLVVNWAIAALAVWVAEELIDVIHLVGLKSILFISLILGLLNVYIKPVLKLITLLITIMTFGLFLIVINTALLLATGRVASKVDGINFVIDGFGPAIIGAIIISIVTFITTHIIDPKTLATDFANRRSTKLSREEAPSVWIQ